MSTKPISQKKLDANRRNAQKSTGPKTPQGKARSSRNAVKHGLLARSIVLKDNDPNENPADFDELLQDLTADLQPVGRLQHLLVERIAALHWRLRRAYRFEVQAIQKLRRGPSHTNVDAPDQTLPTRPILPGRPSMEMLIRYESMIDRELNRATVQLHRHRKPPPRPKNPKPSTRKRHNQTNPTSKSAPIANPHSSIIDPPPSRDGSVPRQLWSGHGDRSLTLAVLIPTVAI